MQKLHRNLNAQMHKGIISHRKCKHDKIDTRTDELR